MAGKTWWSALDTSAATTRIFMMRVLVLTGAGVSAESGIPTFRGKDGYWRNLDPTKLATPEAFATVFKFQLHDYIARKILHQPPQSCNLRRQQGSGYVAEQHFEKRRH